MPPIARVSAGAGVSASQVGSAAAGGVDVDGSSDGVNSLGRSITSYTASNPSQRFWSVVITALVTLIGLLLSALLATTNSRLGEVNARFNTMESSVNTRFNTIESRLNTVDEKLADIDAKLDILITTLSPAQAQSENS